MVLMAPTINDASSISHCYDRLGNRHVFGGFAARRRDRRDVGHPQRGAQTAVRYRSTLQVI